jgi:hypothetical protein
LLVRQITVAEAVLIRSPNQCSAATWTLSTVA